MSTIILFQGKEYTDKTLFELKEAISNNNQTTKLFPRNEDRAEFINNIKFAASAGAVYDCICEYFLDEAFQIELV